MRRIVHVGQVVLLCLTLHTAGNAAMPDADADGQAPVIELAANTASLQVVREVNLGLTGVVFYEAGIADLGQHGTLAADMACLLLLREAGDRLALSAANPLNAAADLTLTLSQKLTGDGVVDLPGGGSQLVLVLPDGRSAGQSVTREFGKP